MNWRLPTYRKSCRCCAILIAILFFFVTGCGKNSGLAEDSTPSFVTIIVWLAGTLPENVSAARVKSYHISTSHCSKKGDNREIRIVASNKDHLENLSKGSKRCKVTLKGFVIETGETEESFLPETEQVAELGIATHYTSAEGTQMSVVPEILHHETLEHHETISFSLMPFSNINPVRAYSELLDFRGSVDVPNLVLNQMADGGMVVGTNTRGLYLFLDCAEPREFTSCSGVNLLDFRLIYRREPSDTPTSQNIATIFSGAQSSIVPGLDHIFRNGLRFYLAIPNDDDGTPASSIGLGVRIGDSYRYFVVDLTNVFTTE